MKKILFLCAALCACTLSTFAHDFEVDSIYYNFLGGDSVEVTYQGSFSTEYNGCSGSVTIPETVSYNNTAYRVTAIGPNAFNYSTSLTDITLPSSVTTIGTNAFYYCSSLTNISIPNSVITIGANAFANCYSLTEISIPNSVTAIGGSAFANCPSLQYKTYDNAQYLGNSENLYHVLARATSTDAVSCTIHENTKVILSGAFSDCSSLTSIILPNNITTISEYMFAQCSSLAAITIPNGVTSIGGYAFYNCSSLTEIIIPNSVTTISDYAFVGCNSLQYNTYDNAQYLGNSENHYHALISATRTDIVSCTIHEDTKVLASRAFFYCSNLTDVIIPNSVMTIGNWAFSGCSKPTSITISNSVTMIGDYAFYGCSSLTEITIPNSVTAIGDYAFSGCSSLTEVTLPNTITKISDSMLNGCSSLTSITIPNSVTTIGGGAFRGCSKLTSIIIPQNVTTIGKEAFPSKLTEITCEAVIPPTVDYYTFYHVDKTIPLYVPAKSIEDYKAADYWSEFTNIQAISTGVANPLWGVSESERKVMENGTIYILHDGEKYTIDGRKVTQGL